MSRSVVLLVEDEPAIADNVVYALEGDGLSVQWARTGGEALALLPDISPALVILDVGLPDVNGFDLCRQMREQVTAPIIFLTARDTEVDRVVGLEIGGDDYVVKPFSPRELAARVRAHLRAMQRLQDAVASPAAEADGFEVDQAAQTARFNGRALALTRYEFRLLATMYRRPERVFSREQLLEAAWDDPVGVFDRTVDTHIKTLRRKLREASGGMDPIRTCRGVGYAYSPERQGSSE